MLTTTTGFNDSHVFTIGASGGTINVASTNTSNYQYYFHTANTLLGSGPLTLTGPGTLTPSLGNLRVDQTNSYSGSLTMQNGGIFEYGIAGAVGAGATFVINNQGELSVQGNSTIALPNNITVSGGTNSVLSFENGTSGVFSGTITLNANAIIGLRDWYNNATVRSGTISGQITGTGALSVNSGSGSGGVLTLSNTANNYSGGTSIGAATVSFTLSAAAQPVTYLGSGTVTLNSGAEISATVNSTTTSQTFGNNFVLNGGTIASTDGNLLLGTGTSTINVTGATTLERQWGHVTTKALQVNGILEGSAALTLQGFSGSTGEGSSIWINNGGNSYSGMMTINANTGSGGFAMVAVQTLPCNTPASTWSARRLAVRRIRSCSMACSSLWALTPRSSVLWPAAATSTLWTWVPTT